MTAASRVPILLSTAAFAAWLAGSPAHANNGAIAFAYPIAKVTIDGESSEWGDEHARFPIERTGEDDAPEASDFQAAFRVAYNLEARALYVVVEVADDVDFRHPEGAPQWNDQDSHLLYVDKQHLPRGSGGVLYQAGKGLREIVSPMADWDPANAGASWNDVAVAIGRHDRRTVYEWRVDLGEELVPNRSIGLDHLLADRDAAEEEARLVLWGQRFGKSTNTYRLGDVLLLERGASLARLEGVIRWRRKIEGPSPQSVRITSVEHPRLWVQARVDADGRYEVTLPAGEYRISSPFRLTDPFGASASPPLRIDDAVTVDVTITAGDTTTAEALVLPTYDRPDYLFGERGVFASFDASRIQEIDAFIESFRRYYAVPGVSVALVHDGKLAYHRHFGVKNRLTREPVGPITVFEAASITKPTFAFAVMRLAERGVIDLDAPLHRYLPFPNIVGDRRYEKMTARHVLSHRSGLPNWAWAGPGTWQDGGDIELNFEPGTAYGYSGEAFNYLGRVLEKITGKDLERLLREEVLVPIGLDNTFFALDEEQARAAFIGHFHDFPSWKRRATEISVASSMHTEARDFASFAIGLIDGVGLAAATYAEMLRPHVTLTEEQRDTAEEQYVGLGFFLRDTPFGRLVEHGGNNGDFRCKFGAVPEAGLAYAIFTNNNLGSALSNAVERYLLFGRGDS